MKTENGVIVQSLARAFEILDCFTGYQQEISIKELSEKMALSKSTVFGLVNTLTVFGYLEQNPENKRYRLGIKLFELGMLVHRRMDLQQEARPFAEALGRKFGSTIHIAALLGESIMYVDKVDAPGAIIMYSQVGKQAPCYSTGVGKAITSMLPPERQDWMLESTELLAFTDKTLTDPKAVKAEWARTRKRGYALDDEEIEWGLRCVAAPIVTHDQLPMGAISVSSPTGRLTPEMVPEVAKEVMRTARDISRRMGSDV